MEPPGRDWLLIIALDVGGMWREDEIIREADSREGCQRPVPDIHTHTHIHSKHTFLNQVPCSPAYTPGHMQYNINTDFVHFLCAFVLIKVRYCSMTDGIWQYFSLSAPTCNVLNLIDLNLKDKDGNLNLLFSNMTLFCKCAVHSCGTGQTICCWPLWQLTFPVAKQRQEAGMARGDPHRTFFLFGS